MSRSIHLGYEVGSGEAVEIPVKHMVVTGQTQESGKTTTLEALISRSGLPAIAFLTKRGEASLAGRQILPYFRERADWQFVQSILESTMHERMKFERSWIVRACHGASTLAGVLVNATKLEAEAKNALSRDVYMLLGEYLKRVVPLIASLPKSGIGPRSWWGIENSSPLVVMDLVAYPQELQMLVIASTLEWIHKHLDGVITIIPEAWKFIPEAKNTPVKVVAESLAREGAALKNYLWIDSQDIAGVAKLLLRSCAVWLIGVQREANEVKRAIANMPEGMKRPKAGDVATLELGQFFCCHGRELRKVYVQPAWMGASLAEAIACGEMRLADIPSSVREMKRTPPAQTSAAEEETMWQEKFEQSEREKTTLQAQLTAVQSELEQLRTDYWALRDKTGGEKTPAPAGAAHPTSPAMPAGGEAALISRVIEQIRRDPVLVKLALEKPVIEVTVRKKVLPMEDSGIKGKVARLIHEGFFQDQRTFSQVKAELVRRGLDPKTPNSRIADPLKEFTELGFFYRNEGGAYELAPDADVRVVNA